MSIVEQQLQLLTQFNLAVRSADPALAVEANDSRHELLEGQGNPSPAAKLAEETIVLRRNRPVLAIKNNQVDLQFMDRRDSGVWRDRLEKAKCVVDAAIRAVGRVEVKGHELPWVGTGWLVAPHVIVTNRHVAREFAERRGETFVFKQGGGEAMTASLDFLQEVDNPETHASRLIRILHIEPERAPDVAFLEVEPLNGEQPVAPIKLVQRPPKATPSVAVIGYPARDVRIPEYELMDRIFGDVYEKKRFAPGAVTGVKEVEIMHDCSTLGGNSGSVVLDLTTGEAIGLHFGGTFLRSNYAVRGDVVRRRLAEVLTGMLRQRPRSEPRSRVIDAQASSFSVVAGAGGGILSVSFPLVVTVSLGTPVRGTRPSTDPSASSVPSIHDDADDGPEAGFEARVADYEDREGYLEGFLGEEFAVALPGVLRGARDVLHFERKGESESELRYQHFSVKMSKSRRICIFSAVNIDGELSRKSKRAGWRIDPRIPREQQILNECYGSAPKFSRGHMTRREDPAWGSPTLAKRGNEDSMHVTNTVPQMQAFNSPIWLGLEDYALQNAREDRMRISVFTGPYLRRSDPVKYGVKIPTCFWKVIAFVHDATGELCATGYEMSQREQLRDQEFVFGPYTSPQLNLTTQVSIASIQSKAGLDFGVLADSDPFDMDDEAASGVGPGPLASFEQIRFTR